MAKFETRKITIPKAQGKLAIDEIALNFEPYPSE